MVGAGTGTALGGWLGGFLFDLSGAYTWSIAVAILTTCLGVEARLAVVAALDDVNGQPGYPLPLTPCHAGLNACRPGRDDSSLEHQPDPSI